MAKFFTVVFAISMAVAAQAHYLGCPPIVGSGCPSLLAPGYPPVLPGYPPVGAPGCLPPHAQKYNVILDNCGPGPAPLPVINAPHQQTPLIEKPVIPLPAHIPAPKTVSNVCRCVKTILKPQVYQQVISVPSVQRYLETKHTPVYETINYEGVPVNCPPNAPEGASPAYINVPPYVPASPLVPSLPGYAPGYAAGCAPAYATGCAPALPSLCL